jgi:hypothetical protein
MFGDIITDLGAMTQGGMGLAAGGNINPQGVSMFEPIGGSAPKYTGQNVINPLAAICAGGMLLEHLGEEKAARSIESAVKQVTGSKLKSMAAGRMGYGTREVGDLVRGVAKAEGQAGSSRRSAAQHLRTGGEKASAASVATPRMAAITTGSAATSIQAFMRRPRLARRSMKSRPAEQERSDCAKRISAQAVCPAAATSAPPSNTAE